MKKTKIIIAIFLLAAIVAGCYTASYFTVSYSIMPHGKCISDENEVKDAFSDSHQLLRCGDNLYYNFIHRDYISKEGLYEIGKNGSRLLVESKDLPYDIYYESNLRIFKGKLTVMGPDTSDYSMDNPRLSGIIHQLNTETGKFEKLSEIKTDHFKIYDFFIDSNTMYIVSDKKIYSSSDGVHIKPVISLKKIKKINDHFIYTISGDTLVYLGRDNYFYEYNIKDKKYTAKTKLPKKLSSNGWIVKTKSMFLYVVETNNHFEIYNVSKSVKKVFFYKTEYGICSCCGYGDKLFFGDVNGSIASLDLKSGRGKILVSSGADDLYVFGDKWIYYTGDYTDTSIYRVSQDGKVNEKIFG